MASTGYHHVPERGGDYWMRDLPVMETEGTLLISILLFDALQELGLCIDMYSICPVVSIS